VNVKVKLNRTDGERVASLNIVANGRLMCWASEPKGFVGVAVASSSCSAGVRQPSVPQQEILGFGACQSQREPRFILQGIP
jgi:hypothetical protein